MPSRSEKYFSSVPRDGAWPAVRIKAESQKWRTDSVSVYVYFYTKGDVKNAIIESGPSLYLGDKVRKRQKPCRLLLCLRLPPYRNYSAKDVCDEISSKGPLSERVRRAISFSKDRGCAWGVSEELVEFVSDDVAVPRHRIISST